MKKERIVFSILCTVVAFVMILSSSVAAFASGFALIDQSVEGLGIAYSGGAAMAEDASTIFYNPAGMTRLKGVQLETGLHIIMPSIKFKDNSAFSAIGVPISGGNGKDAGVTRLVPNFYLTVNPSDRLVLGLGVNSPFGLATEYSNGWVGRYYALKSDMYTININPSVAYKITDDLSLGAGFSAQYINAEL